MKIPGITTWIVNLDFRNVIIVKVQTNTGISGGSKTVMKRRTPSIQQSILELNRHLVGKDPTEIENHEGWR
jgi:galactonate dehydratase